MIYFPIIYTPKFVIFEVLLVMHRRNTDKVGVFNIVTMYVFYCDYVRTDNCY